MTAQLAFGMGAATRLPWTGTPLRYHTAYATPEQHAAAVERWIEEHGRFGWVPRSHMWHAVVTARELDGHTLHVLCADARRRDGDPPGVLGALVPDRQMWQAICTACRWHSIHERESEAVEAWHDHAAPGWRDLPVMPLGLRAQDWTKPGKAAAAWLEEHYPDAQPGSPVITERQRGATRHVPGGSPFFGYDLAHIPTTDSCHESTTTGSTT